MAVKNCEDLSNIIALGVISGNEELANEISRLSAKKKDALVRAGKLGENEEVDTLTGWTAHELELRANSADIEMRAIVQAKILSDEVRVGDAYRELAEQIRRSGGTISDGVDLLEKLRNASPADYEDIAKQWGGAYADNPAQAIEEIKQAISENISANYSIRQYSEIKGKGLEKLRNQLRKGEITQGVFDDEVKKFHNEAMEQIAKGENPKDFAKLDEEWATIKKIFGDDPISAGKAWSQFIMARELLSDGAIDDGVLKAFEGLGAENLTGELTLDQIAKYGKDDLDKLLARAYTNTEQLYRDGILREAYRDKLVELTSGMRVSQENMKKAKSIMSTMEFAEKGATFSDVVTADNAIRSASKRGIKVKDGTQLIHGIKAFAKKMGEDENILKNPIKIAGAEFKPLDLIQVIYDITGDENILKLLRVGFFNDGTVLSVATSSLLGGNKEAADRILRLFSKAKEAPLVSNVRDTSLKAITGSEIKEGAKIGFFDFRKPLYQKDELNRAKADFMDKLAEKNKMRIDGTDVEEIANIDDAQKLAESLSKFKGGYIIVNDGQWRTNSVFSEAIDIANEGLKDEEKITILYPRGGMSSSFAMENGQLFFKTLKDDIFRDVAGTISIQTLGEARPTREILATATEAATGKNADKLRYQPSYSKGVVDNLGRQISDQQYEYFKNSIIRDANGNLIMMRHGTDADFDFFEYGYVNTGNEGPGFYTSADRYKPNEYGSRIIECYVNIENPINLESYKIPYRVFYDIADDGLQQGRLTKEAYDDLVAYVKRSQEYSKSDYITSSLVGFLGEYTHRVNRGHPNLVGKDVNRVSEFTAKRHGYRWFFSEFNAKTGFDGIVNHRGDDIYTAVAFFPRQMKYVDNRVPTVDPDMRFQRNLGWDTGVKGLEGLRSLFQLEERYIGDKTVFPKAIQDYVYEGLENTRIKNLITKDGYINHKEFDKLTWDEKFQVMNRFETFQTLYEVEYMKNSIEGIKDRELYNRIVQMSKRASEIVDKYSLRGGVRKIFEEPMELGEFVHYATDGGFLPYECGIITTVDNKVLSAEVATPNTNWMNKASADDAKNRGGVKYFHNHPNGSFFSSSDLTHIPDFVETIGLILPGGVRAEFPVNYESIKILKEYVGFKHAEGGRYATLAESGIANLYLASEALGIVDNQTRGEFDDIIKIFQETGDVSNDIAKEKLAGRVVDRLYDMEEWFIDALTPEGATGPAWMRRLGQYADQADMTPTDAMKVQMFTKDRTWKQIADAYGFNVKLVEGDMIEGVKAYGAYGNGLIYFSDLVKESTAPHELFHAVFDLVGKEQHDKILADAMKIFGYDANTAEEVLADSFAHWFKTGEFVYGEGAMKGKKTFFKQVQQFFRDVAEWLGLLADHRTEVGQMFNDMVNLKYLPDAGKNVDAVAAMAKYNDELNVTATKYFGEMLGENAPKVIDNEYIGRVQNLLSDRLGIDVKAFDQIDNKSALWQRINQQFTLERFTTGKYDRQVVDINAIKNKIAGFSDDELDAVIKEDLGETLIRGTIKGNENIEHIREAYLDYKTAGTAIDSLAAKGKIVSLANGGTAQTMSMQEIRDMFTNGTFEDVYKKMFLSNQTLTKKEMERFVSAINNNIFDTLSIAFAENLVSAGYSLPLINMKTFVYEYLRGNLDLNNKFVESFLYKNKIPFSSDGLKSVVDTLMPTEFKFDYEDSLFKGRFNTMEVGNKSVVVESPNRFLQDSYSALASVEMAKAGQMPVNYEEDILKGILDKYVKEVYDGVKAGTLTFQGAQQLKQEASYALDMFEQDFLLPRYGKFLSEPEKKSLLGMKYQLPIGVKGQNPDKVLQELNSIRTKLVNKYETTLGGVARNNDINMSILKGVKGENDKMQKMIDERRQQLMDNGGVIREVNGQYLVYDVKQALADTIAQLPQNIGGLEGIRALGRSGLEGLSNRQAYALLRYLEAAKGLNSTLNLATELIYKQNPTLQRYNFFQSYKIGDTGLPRALEGNLLNMDKFLSQFDNISGLDNVAKKNIFDSIVSKFREQGYITTKDLDKIIDNGITEAQASFRQVQFSPKDTKKAVGNMKLVYKKVFEPYVHVRDIPKGGTLIDGRTQVRNIKQKVADTMKLQYNQAVKDLEAAGMEDLKDLQTSIFITTNDGEKISLQKAGEMNIDSWKKSVFNDESVFVAGADELKKFEGSPDDKALVAKQKEWRNEIISQYDSNLSAMLNQTQYISKAESDLSTAFMNDVRTSMRQYTLTNKIVDALDALSGLNEEAARGIKDYLIGWKGNISFGKWGSGQIKDRLELVQEAYSKYYAMDISKLSSAKPSTQAEDLALRLAKYFKNLERLLGSADGLTGCTTKAELNRAFFHIGEVVKNVDTVKGVFGLLSGVEQNQILKFFKFAEGDLRREADVFIRRGKGNFQESLGGYRDYAEDISGITRDEFNEIFAANFSEGDFKRVLQGLTGFSLTGSRGKTGMKILNVLNGSNFLFRFLMSYPGQLLTIPQQSLAYFLKQIGFEKDLGVESMSDVDAVRMHYGILDGAYNEIVLRGKSTVNPDDLRLDSYYNRYGIPDVDEIYKTSRIETSDDYINMYAKIDNHAASSVSATNKWFRQLDPYKDNANNIIDGLFARNFKNISFLKAIRGNDFLQFGSAKEFMSFMDDPRISAEVKTRLMDRVSAYSGRNFRNILGLGFGGIDRAVAGSGFGNIMYGLMQLFNFRGSWGQNIFKQTGANIFTALKMLAKGRRSREGKEAIAEYIAKQPEFTNFIGALFNDLEWTWKLQRFQDNGRWPDDEDFYDGMDFIEYMTDTLNMTSQWFQGLQSFGPLRPFEEQARSIFASHMNPTIYKDTFGVGAFMNALGKNFGRQRKPYNWIAKWIGAFTTGGPEEAKNYLKSERWKLSFGSLRYMVNEDMNAYGYTYDMSGETGGIPNILMGESKLNSDKNFTYEIDNTETWETLGQIFDGDIPRDSRWTYIGNLAKSFVNGSQLASLPKNVWKAITRDAPSYSSANDLADTMQKTEAGLEFYRSGIVTPKTPQEAEIFFNTMLANAKYRPGSSNFTKSLIQYEDYGHMDGKNGKKADAEMELRLDHMKHLTNKHGEFETHGGQKVVDPSWNKLIQDVRLHGYNETYTTNLIYNYSKNWLNNHSSDPNYQLYVKMLGQGQAHNLIEYKTSQLLSALNAGKKGADNKWTKTELSDVGIDINLLLRLGNSKVEGEDMTLFDKLQTLDEDDATVAALQIIKSQSKEGDRKVLDKFFDVEEQDDGTKVVTLKYQYEQTLKQIGAVAKAIDSGNTELAVAEASTLVNMYKQKDPTGAVTATVIDSIYNRIYDTDSLSPSQKQAAMIALFHKNKDFIQRNAEKLREVLGDDYDVYADYMNSMLYQWDGMTISNLESMQSSGKSSSGASKAAMNLSAGLKNLAASIGGNSNSGSGSTGSYKDWVPVVIKGANLIQQLGLKGYTPEVNNLKVSSYSPHVDFSLAKDVNRSVKGPKTQAVAKKKQLSKLETDVEKALEAES